MFLLPYELKPRFIPLQKQYFRQFQSGDKVWEYRLHCKTWREENAMVGRRVKLSMGYGKAERMNGVIAETKIIPAKGIAGASEIYHPKAELYAMRINQLSEVYTDV